MPSLRAIKFAEVDGGTNDPSIGLFREQDVVRNQGDPQLPTR
jgi:hypothetical protein